MIYDLYIRSMKTNQDGSGQPVVIPIAKLNYDGRIEIGWVLHLREEDMLEGIAPTSVRVEEIEYKFAEDRYLLGVSTNSGTVVNSNVNGSPIQIPVPCIGNSVESSLNDFFGEVET